ncbi:MAG: hypothetical protein Q8K58_01145 [Acidimicrobiales bacterium]|nr:hypothetical protein [Acidimicrobiales bacterium]
MDPVGFFAIAQARPDDLAVVDRHRRLTWAEARVNKLARLLQGAGLHCRENLAAYKCPRSIDFEDELPRHPTGKLYKRLLRDRYWSGAGRLI